MTGPDTEQLDTTATHAALAGAGTLRWWQTTAFLEAAGPDAVTLLDGLCTQAVDRIAPGTARLGLFLDPKARIIAPAVLHRLADAPWTDPKGDGTASGEPAPRVLLETLPDLVEPLRAHLAKYRLRAKVALGAVDLATIAVCRSDSAPTPAELPTPPLGGAWTVLEGAVPPAAVWIGDADTTGELVRELLPAAGIVAADPDTLESVRIDAGVAGLHDLLAGSMPAEVGGMRDAVALDAGCYLGQEPVARLHYRGHANRSLRRLSAAAPITPVVGDEPDPSPFELRAPDADPGSRPAGRLTTWATRPDGSVAALGVVRRELAVGDVLRLAGSSSDITVNEPSPGAEPAV